MKLDRTTTTRITGLGYDKGRGCRTMPRRSLRRLIAGVEPEGIRARAGLPQAVRRPHSRRLGGPAGILVGRGPRHHRPDHEGEPAQGEHVPVRHGRPARTSSSTTSSCAFPTASPRTTTAGFANSGIQYRSRTGATSWRPATRPTSRPGRVFSGILYDEAGGAGGRGIMAERGEKVTWTSDGKKEVTGRLGSFRGDPGEDQEG